MEYVGANPIQHSLDNGRRTQYQENRRAPLGTVIHCAHCGRAFRKKESTSQFCSNRGERSCKNRYWSAHEKTN